MFMEDLCNSDVLYSKCLDIENFYVDIDVFKINELVDGIDISKSCVLNVEIIDCSNILEGDKVLVIIEIFEDVKG